jgi:dolichyl-phosphate beta-glucosyltransferase
VRISIVLPAFNEENRIGATLDALAAYRDGVPHHLEPVVVDDGSTDATYAVAESYREKMPDLVLIRHDANRGKGRAVANGMLTGTGEYRAFFDADGATPFSALEPLLEACLGAPKAVAIGSVRAPGALIVEPQPRLRSLVGQAGNALIRAMALPGVSDSQRGCKLFPASVAEVVFDALDTDRWGFDIEVLARCRHLGYDILEVPVEWRHVDGSQVGAGAYLSTLAEVTRIRRTIRSWEYPSEAVREEYPASVSVPNATVVAAEG